MFSVREFKYQFLQSFSIVKSVINCLVYACDMEIALKIFKVFHKEIKQIFTVIPLSE